MASGNNQPDSLVKFERVTKRFESIVAARDVTLSINEGEFLSFLGPSGCGKTTLLRMIAGFEKPSEGKVFLQGRCINEVPAYQRPVNMVFQHYALFPHLNVAANVGYGLKQRAPRPSRKQLKQRVAEALELVQLGGFEKRRMWEMSGGQQQRVALARALINKPQVLLLDEPLAALDRKLRRDMQIELQNLQRNVGITFVLVTHDQEEALSMSDRVCIMRDGEIVQSGSPRELYDKPNNRYIADFVGKSNFFNAVINNNTDENTTVTLDNGQVITTKSPHISDVARGQRVTVSVRPEQMMLARRREALPAKDAVTLDAIVRNRIFLGEHTEYLLHNDVLGNFLALSPRQSERVEPPFDVNESIHAAWSQDTSLILHET